MLRVSEKRKLRKIFERKKHEVTGKWRRLLNKELHDLHSSPNIIWVIKSRRKRWTGQVAHMEERKGAYRWGNLRDVTTVKNSVYMDL
jgi:hypothetical protein